jgi:hypothetical protein
MGHSRTPTQNTAGDGFLADPVDGYVRASIKASPDKSPTRRLVIEATYDLSGHPGTGTGTGRHHHPPGPPAPGADTGGGRSGGAMRSSPQRANRASPGRCCLRHVP